MEKIDFKKKYKEIYKVKKPSVVTFPKLNYVSIKGEGSPASELFKQSIGALFSTAYTISMSYKGDFEIEGFHNFVVPPLEGVWDLIDTSVEYNGNKDNLKWTIMIMMPDFVTEEVLEEAKQRANEKKPNDLIEQLNLITFEEHKCCISLHVGSFDTESETFNEMDQFLEETNYKRVSKEHREIYLSDFNKVEASKLKTVLCYDIEEK